MIRYLIVVVFALTSCTSIFHRAPKEKPGVRLSSVRPEPEDMKVIPSLIQRDTFVQSLEEKNLLYRLRAVPVYQRGSTMEGAIPEYRLFELAPESPYVLLGLKAGDILLAADDWVIYDPRRFIAYVELLANLNEGKIRIKRDGQEILLKYTLIPALASQEADHT
ncbi:MAG: serine protease [Bdellovibrionales bacterium]|nr:serine protease [Bdellovibrionales bacterium]